MSFRRRVHEALENPRAPWEKGLAWTLLGAILASIFLLGVQVQYPDFYSRQQGWFAVVNYAILGLFTLEYLIRLCVAPRPLRYAFGFGGVVDLLAILPSWLGVFTPVQSNFAWVRSVRVLRFLRVLKLVGQRGKAEALWSGILARIGPYIGVALVFKLLVLVGEAQPWWFDLSQLGTMLAVVGFAIGVMLGAKLSTAHGRMHAVEDAVTSIVGDLRGLAVMVAPPELLHRWAAQLRDVLRSGDGAERFQRETHGELAGVLAEQNAPPPMVADLHQQTSFLMLRMVTRTPVAYERFLRYVTVFYTLVVVLSIPGLVGLVSVALVVYVLGGMYVVIDDMDTPISYDREALVNADLSPLDVLLDEWQGRESGAEEPAESSAPVP